MNKLVKTTLSDLGSPWPWRMPQHRRPPNIDRAGVTDSDASTSPDAAVTTNDAAIADAGASTADPVAAFLGTWNYVSGVGSLACGDATPIALHATGFVTFLRGAGANQVLVVDDQGCETPGSVSGNLAVVVPGSTCPDAGVTYSSLVYTLAAGTMREQLTAQVDVQGDDDCTASGDSSLTRD